MRVLADEWGMTHDNMDMFGGGQISFHGVNAAEKGSSGLRSSLLAINGFTEVTF